MRARRKEAVAAGTAVVVVAVMLWCRLLARSASPTVAAARVLRSLSSGSERDEEHRAQEQLRPTDKRASLLRQVRNLLTFPLSVWCLLNP